LHGRTVLIAGAARGQGEAHARRGIQEGANVTSEQAWAVALALAAEMFGALDGLVDNAGVVHTAMLEDPVAAAALPTVLDAVPLGRGAAPAEVSALVAATRHRLCYNNPSASRIPLECEVSSTSATDGLQTRETAPSYTCLSHPRKDGLLAYNLG
jgi:hypothetical protein